MAYPTVNGKIIRPGQQVPVGATVLIELVGENGARVTGAVDADENQIEGAYEPAVSSATGAWSTILTPNSLIEPEGTVYLYKRNVDGVTVSTPFSVPDDTGPFWVMDLQTDLPGSLPTGPLAAEIARAEEAESQRVETSNGGKEDYDNVGNSTGAVDIDLADGNVQRIVLTGDTTLSISGATNSKACSLTLVIVQDATGGHAVTWPAGTKTDNGIGIVASTAANAVDVVCLLSVDGGTTWYAFLAGQAMA